MDFQRGIIPAVTSDTNIPSTFTEKLYGQILTLSVEKGATYLIVAQCSYIDNKINGILGASLRITSGENTVDPLFRIRASSQGGAAFLDSLEAGADTMTFQTGAYSWTAGNIQRSACIINLLRVK